MDIDEYCREKVAIPGSSYYYSILFLSPERQKPLNVIYAFKTEIEGIRSSSDPGITRLKLEWWREELRRALEGAPQHPVAQGIAQLIAEYDLAPTDLLAIIDSAERR
jgi:phytoene synthase